MKQENPPDFYLVMTGPRGAGPRGGPRPLAIDAVYLFETRPLFDSQLERGAKIGTAASVPNRLWEEAEVYPENRAGYAIVSAAGVDVLRLFASPTREPS